MQNFGQMIRVIRIQKKYGLNEFAREIGVSPGYLSNLETGKTMNIQLDILEKIQNKLGLDQRLILHEETEFECRLNRMQRLLSQMNQEHPVFADYLLQTIESGLGLPLEDL